MEGTRTEGVASDREKREALEALQESLARVRREVAVAETGREAREAALEASLHAERLELQRLLEQAHAASKELASLAERRGALTERLHAKRLEDAVLERGRLMRDVVFVEETRNGQTFTVAERTDGKPLTPEQQRAVGDLSRPGPPDLERLLQAGVGFIVFLFVVLALVGVFHGR